MAWPAHGEIFSKSYWIEPKSDYIYHFRIYLEFGTKRTHGWFQINRKMVNTICFRFNSIRFICVYYSMSVFYEESVPFSMLNLSVFYDECVIESHFTGFSLMAAKYGLSDHAENIFKNLIPCEISLRIILLSTINTIFQMARGIQGIFPIA